MAFKFSNMATYVRNVIEPLIKSERIMAHSELTEAIKTLRTELDEVNRSFDAYKRETDARISAMQIDYQTRIDAAIRTLANK